MAQAQDEVAFAKISSGQNEAAIKILAKDDDDDDDDDDDISVEDDDECRKQDEMLEDDQLAIKTIRKKMVKAQIKIAELVALLDEAKVAMDAAYKDDEEEAKDCSAEKDKDDLATSDAAEFLVPGKKKLKSVQRDLRKAMEEWNDALLVGTKDCINYALVDMTFGL
jgi:hypothetical protein